MVQIDRKKPVWIEWWNALSMLPGFYFIYHHLQKEACASLFQRLGVYSYGFLCLLSMHCHLYRSRCSYSPEESKRYMRFLRMDLVAQSVAIALNAYDTPMGVFGMLWGVAGVALDIYNTSGRRTLDEYIERKDLWIRPIHEGVLICLLTRHCPTTLWLFVQAFVCFALCKLWWPLEFLHGVFHLLTHDAMNALWFAQYDYRAAIGRNGGALGIVPDALAGVVAVGLLYTIVSCYGARWKYFDRVLTSTYFAGISLWVYAGFYDATKLFAFVPLEAIPFVGQVQVYSELCYYVAAAAVEIYEREWVLLGHHIVAFWVIYGASALGYAHLLVWCLAMFMPSNVPLTVSKWARAAGHERLARGAFAVFTAMYIGCRMTGLTWFVYKTLIEAYGMPWIPLGVYVGMNGLILTLYGFHGFWLVRIGKIWGRMRQKSVRKIE